MDPVHAMTVTKDVAVFCNLQQERSSTLALFPFYVLDEEYAPFVIELDFSIDKIRSCYLNRLATGFLCNHVDGFLWKGVPQK